MATRAPKALTLIFLLAACATITTQCQPHLDWARTYSLNPSGVNQSIGVVLCPDGSIATCGASANAAGNLDYLVAKYSPHGDQLWVRRFDDNGASDQPRKFAVAPNGNITITGTTKTISFSALGNLLWAQPFGGRDLIVNSTNVCVTGFSEVDLATAMLNASTGTNIWTSIVDGDSKLTDVATAMTQRANGDIVVVGTEVWGCLGTICYQYLDLLSYDASGRLNAKNQMVIGNGYASRMVYNQVISHEDGGLTVIGRIPAVRAEFWVNQFSNVTTKTWDWTFDRDEGYVPISLERAACADQQGNVYLTGSVGLPEDQRVTTLKLKRDGHQAWRTEFRGAGYGVHQGEAIQLDQDGNVYVAGYGVGPAGQDIIVTKTSLDGIEQWVQWYDSPNHLTDTATAIAIDSVGNIYVSGYSSTPQGGTEMLLLKYSQLPKIDKQPSGAMQLQFLTDPNTPYILQATTNYLDWTSVLTNTADPTGLVQFDDPAPTLPLRLYRGAKPQ